MALSRVYVLCATLVLTIVKVHTAPIGGLLSGLFGGDDGRPKLGQLDVNQLLGQYYPQQQDPMSQWPNAGPLQWPNQLSGQLNGGIAPPGFITSDSNPLSVLGYPSYNGLNLQPYQQPNYQNYNLGYGDPYAQYQQPYYRGGLGSAEDSPGAVAAASADSSNGAAALADAASYRNLGNQQSAEVSPSQAGLQALLNSQQAQVPVASSLVGHRLLPEGAVPQPAAASSSETESNVKEQ